MQVHEIVYRDYLLFVSNVEVGSIAYVYDKRTKHWYLGTVTVYGSHIANYIGRYKQNGQYTYIDVSTDNSPIKQPRMEIVSYDDCAMMVIEGHIYKEICLDNIPCTQAQEYPTMDIALYRLGKKDKLKYFKSIDKKNS